MKGRQKHKTLIRLLIEELDKPTHTLVPCWMIVALPPRNECMGCFTPAMFEGAIMVGAGVVSTST